MIRDTLKFIQTITLLCRVILEEFRMRYPYFFVMILVYIILAICSLIFVIGVPNTP